MRAELRGKLSVFEWADAANDVDPTASDMYASNWACIRLQKLV